MKLIKRFLMVIVALTIFVTTTATITKVNAVTSTYKKVTTQAELTTGQYLIVCEASNVAFDGSLTSLDAVKNTVSVTIDTIDDSKSISGDFTNNEFTIDVQGLTIKSASNKYIGRSSNSNGLDTSDDSVAQKSITIDSDGNAVVTALGGTYLKFNVASNQSRFRYFKNGQTGIQLYKKQVVASYTVTYDYNDGTGNKTVLTLAEGASISENAPKNLTRAGYKHIGWSDASDSTTVLEGFDGLTVSASVTYYAVWQATETKNLTLNANGGNFSSEITTVTPYEKGTTITLSELTKPEYDANHVFEGWSNTLNGAVIADTTITLNEDITLYAVWHEYTALEKVKSLDVTNSAQSNLKFSYTETTVPAEKEGWFLVTNASDLKVGDKVVIVAKASSYAMSTTQGNNNRSQVEIIKSSDLKELTINDNVQQLTLETGSTANTFAFDTGTGYLYAASSSSNYLRTQENVDDNASFSITIGSDGVATIKANGKNTKNLLQHNSSSKIFSCYSSNQQSVVLYKLVSETKSYEVESMTLNVRVSMDKADYEYIMAKDSDSVFAFDVTVSGVNKNVEITKFSEENDKVVFYLSINNIPTDKFALEFVIDLYYLGNDGSHSLSLGNFSVIKTVNKYIEAPNDVINEHMGVLKYISTLN